MSLPQSDRPGQTPLSFILPYGRGTVEFRVPAAFAAQKIESRPMTPISDPAGAIREALERPAAGPPLRNLARSGMKVAIVVTDSTRACPDDLLVPPLLDELARAGVPDSDIRVVIGIGLHRPSGPEEYRLKLGEGVVSRVEVINPRPTDPADLVDLGVTSEGVPAIVNRTVAEADIVIATGIVEPHQYAGYSGGRKTVAIGAGSEPTIAVSHGPKMIEHPQVRLGQIDGNPFHNAITEIARRAGLLFILNVVSDDDGRILAVAAGSPEETYAGLVEIARSTYTVDVAHQADVIVAGVGYPKDANLYQASRAASYLRFAPTPVVRKGGVIIIPAQAPEGIGEGLGERRFGEIVKGARSVGELIETVRREGYPAGGQRAFVMAKVLEHCDVIVALSVYPRLARDLKLRTAETVEEAFEQAESILGGSASLPYRTYVIPHALLTLPIVRSAVPA